MTAKEVMDEANRLRVHRYGDAAMLRHLSRLENMLRTEVLKLSPRALRENDELLVCEPYDQMYELYLCAQIDLLDMEIERYNAGMAAFQSLYEEFAKWHRRAHQPPKERGVHGYV